MIEVFILHPMHHTTHVIKHRVGVIGNNLPGEHKDVKNDHKERNKDKSICPITLPPRKPLEPLTSLS